MTLQICKLVEEYHHQQLVEQNDTNKCHINGECSPVIVILILFVLRLRVKNVHSFHQSLGHVDFNQVEDHCYNCDNGQT